MIYRETLGHTEADAGRYAMALLAVVCALTLRMVFHPILGDWARYMFFVVAIVAVRHLCGRGPALLATLLGGIAAGCLLLAPQFPFSIASRADNCKLAAYFVIGAGISFLGEVSLRIPALVNVRGRNIRARVLRQTVVLAMAAGVLASMVLLLLHEFRRTQEAAHRVAHTYRVLSSAESLLSFLTDAETGQRGFLLTGDKGYLTPYNAAIAIIPEKLKELRDLTSDNPRQQGRLTELDRLAAQGLAALGQVIGLYSTSNAAAALVVLRSGRGKHYMDDLRSTLDAVRSEEMNLLMVRQAQAEEVASRERWVLGLGCGVLIALLVIASMVIEKETIRREEISESLSRHVDLLEQTHDSLLTCRLGGPIEYWSRGAETLFGYKREETVGRRPHELLRTSHPSGMAQIDALLERDGEWQGELTQTTKDGRNLTVEARWTLSGNAEGKKTVLEANHDITRRKQAEAANVLLATALEQAAETVVVTDREAYIQYVNPAFTRTTGYSRQEVLGQNPRVLRSGQHDAGFYQTLWSQLGEGKLWRGEFTNRRKDGTLYREEATIAPVRAAGGEITNYIAIKSDITERRRSEIALRESELMLRLFVQHAPAAIAMLDREMRFLVVSRRWTSDFRLGDREIRGLSHYEVFPELPASWKEVHARCLAGAVERCMDDPFPRPDGTVDWLSWEVRPWAKADESIGGIIILCEFVTERKRAEEQVRLLNVELEQRVRSRTAELESANRELEAFAHSVSHDLRAPLRGIDGWSLALLQDNGDRLGAQGHKCLERVRSEAQHMGRRIDDLLHPSRVGRAELKFSAVDLSCLAERIVGRLQEAQPGRSIEFSIAPRLKCGGDARLLEVALTNLLTNAAKFTAPRNPARVEFGERNDNGHKIFFVRDNGVGFDMAYAKMLFAPFQRLHKTSEFPGTGIGLATVQRVIHRHGGRVWADAQVGGGATIFFTLGEKP